MREFRAGLLLQRWSMLRALSEDHSLSREAVEYLTEGVQTLISECRALGLALTVQRLGVVLKSD